MSVMTFTAHQLEPGKPHATIYASFVDGGESILAWAQYRAEKTNYGRVTRAQPLFEYNLPIDAGAIKLANQLCATE